MDMFVTLECHIQCFHVWQRHLVLYMCILVDSTLPHFHIIIMHTIVHM